MNNFKISRIPEIIFEPRSFEKLPGILSKYGQNVLIITGGNSLEKSGNIEKLKILSEKYNFVLFYEKISSEPSPSVVDKITSAYRDKNISAIASIGGGSVIDCGKAVSAMLCEECGIYEFLEGIGTKNPSGKKIPFIAVPTTAGTGSETTKNAVFSEIGPRGFKKSLRHDNYVPDIALLDPILTLSLPAEITAAGGFDALSQLIESYLSNKNNPFTDALALSGIKAVSESLLTLYSVSPEDISLRAKMSYASMVSGITLANAGLIVIHGLAGTIGGYFNAAHGVICGILLPAALDVILIKLKSENNEKYISRYSDIYFAMTGEKAGTIISSAEKLVTLLYQWKKDLNLPGLSSLLKLDISSADYDDALKKITENSDQKNNPVKLSPEDMRLILKMCN